jgi:hypothetical protein
MLAAYFCHSCSSQVALYWSFSYVKFAQSTSQIEEIYQTLLTNKKQGNLDYIHVANIVKPTQTRLTARNTLFAL